MPVRFSAWIVALAIVATGASARPETQGGAAAVAPAQPDLKRLLFLASDALGILRGLRQEDSLTTMEFWARGSMTEAGETYPVTSYRGSLRFRDVLGMRVDFTRTSTKTKTPERIVQVVSGTNAWNEREPGVDGTPVAGAAAERRLQVMAMPYAVLKTARDANAQVSTEGSFTVLSFAAPDVPGATVKTWLNAKRLIERVETRLGETTTETSYSNYADWNDKDYKADIWFPGRIVRKQGGATLLDLTVTRTNTYNPYVVMPLPAGMSPAAGSVAPTR